MQQAAPVTPSQDPKQQIVDFVQDFTIETTPGSAAKIADFREHLRPGTKVAVTFLPGSDFADTIAVSRRLRDEGFEPMPHLAARSIPSKAQLDDWLQALTGEVGVAEVVALNEFATTLAGQTAPVIIQLPEVETQSVFTTATVPDGGSILLGGLSRLRNIERRAEVPWLAKIPLLGFFFKEEGYNDERESLMIMLRAWITDAKEELDAFEE